MRKNRRKLMILLEVQLKPYRQLSSLIEFLAAILLFTCLYSSKRITLSLRLILFLPFAIQFGFREHVFRVYISFFYFRIIRRFWFEIMSERMMTLFIILKLYRMLFYSCILWIASTWLFLLEMKHFGVNFRVKSLNILLIMLWSEERIFVRVHVPF